MARSEWAITVHAEHSGIELVRIKPSGEIWVNPDVPLDELARQFVERVRKFSRDWGAGSPLVVLGDADLTSEEDVLP